jgi:hypothetical protein
MNLKARLARVEQAVPKPAPAEADQEGFWLDLGPVFAEVYGVETEPGRCRRWTTRAAEDEAVERIRVAFGCPKGEPDEG